MIDVSMVIKEVMRRLDKRQWRQASPTESLVSAMDPIHEMPREAFTSLVKVLRSPIQLAGVHPVSDKNTENKCLRIRGFNVDFLCGDNLAKGMWEWDEKMWSNWVLHESLLVAKASFPRYPDTNKVEIIPHGWNFEREMNTTNPYPLTRIGKTGRWLNETTVSWVWLAPDHFGTLVIFGPEKLCLLYDGFSGNMDSTAFKKVRPRIRHRLTSSTVVAGYVQEKTGMGGEEGANHP